MRDGVTVSGAEPVAVRIDERARGSKGAVVISLVKTGANVLSVPAGAMLSEAQLAAYRKGARYGNVQSTAHHGSDIRGQIEFPTPVFP